MDFENPIEAVIPGSSGRLLAALARVDAELPVGRLAQVAGVGRTMASGLVGELAELGIVSRREVGRTALVRLNRENLVGDLVGRLGGIREIAIEKLRQLASRLEPRPLSLLVYGSFARGTSGPGSDIDVLAIRPIDTDPEHWSDALTAFSASAAALTGNSVQILDYEAQDFAQRYATREGDAGAEFWLSVSRDAVLLAGRDLGELVRAGHDSWEEPSHSE
jgi:predicted nucleotidyltransferase